MLFASQTRAIPLLTLHLLIPFSYFPLILIFCSLTEFSQGLFILTDEIELSPFSAESFRTALMGVRICTYLHNSSGKHMSIHCSLLQSSGKRHHLAVLFKSVCFKVKDRWWTLKCLRSQTMLHTNCAHQPCLITGLKLEICLVPSLHLNTFLFKRGAHAN